MTIVLDTLARRQREVATTAGSALVIAGAGKTTALTATVEHRIAVCGAAPSHVLAVPFTDKAVREMTKRIRVVC